LAAVACQQAPTASPTVSATADTSKRGGTLRVSTLGGAPKILHPYVPSENYTTPWADGQTLMWASLISTDYDKLEFHRDPGTDLATDMPKISADGKTFTFTLRDDIKWSDGKPITSADFQFAWDNASKKENDWVAYDDVIDQIATFKTPDPKTVEITLKDQLAKFLAYVIVSSMTPVPKHVWEGKPWLDAGANPEVTKPSVVPGPYLPKELSAERHVYARNPQWWGKVPNLDEVQFIAANPNTVVELLNTSQVEWCQNVPAAQLAAASAISHAYVIKVAGAAGSYRVMQFNLTRPNLKDKKFREALVRALKRDDFIQFENGLATPQYGLYTQNNKWKSDAVEKYDYDLDKAKKLLTDAGYKLDGTTLKGADGKAVKVELLWPTTSAARGKMATYAQQQWKQLGIDTTVTGLEFNAFVDRYSRKKDFDIAMGSFLADLDPDGVKSQIKTGGTQNAMTYSNKRVDELLDAGTKELDDTKRKSIYDEIQKLVSDDLPMYSMVTLISATAFDKKVKGVSQLKGSGDLLEKNNMQVLEWYLDPK
jgi:peptide/nickel transport system substrate-binding protein